MSDAEWLRTMPDNVIEEIIKIVADMGCASKDYPALCNTSTQFRSMCNDQRIWEQRCKEMGWDTRPSPMRTWFAHYMINYCNGYWRSMNDMLLHAAQRGDVLRVKAALASGADPTRSDRFLRYAVGSIQPTLKEYATARGDMVGVVKLLLQFGRPPKNAVRETLSHIFKEAILDDDYQPLDSYEKLHVEFVSKPSYEVGSLLLDYIQRTKYALWDTYERNILTFVDMSRSLLFSGESVKALELLVRKVPSLSKQTWTSDVFDAYEAAPYGAVIRRRFGSDKIGYRMLQVLLDYDFPTELSTEKEPSYNRYATIVAAVEGDCHALGMLHSYGAAFPPLNQNEVQQLMTAIENRRQEKLAEIEMTWEDEDEMELYVSREELRAALLAKQQLCDMPTYLRQLGLIRA